jgi:hypothetical protein
MTPSVMLGNYSAKNIVPESTIPFNVMKPTSLTNTQNLGPSYPGSEMLFKSNTLPDQNLGKNYKVGKATDSNVENSGLSMGDKTQLAGLAPATIYNTIQALRPAEKFSPLNSPLFGAGLNDMNQNVRFNTNPILMNRNVGANQINQGSTSDAVRRANLQSLYRGTNTQLGEMAEKEALANAQKYSSKGEVITGSTNTSHNSYLPQLKTIFGEAKNLGNPVFLGNKPMNSMGFLSNFGYSQEDSYIVIFVENSIN